MVCLWMVWTDIRSLPRSSLFPPRSIFSNCDDLPWVCLRRVNFDIILFRDSVFMACATESTKLLKLETDRRLELILKFSAFSGWGLGFDRPAGDLYNGSRLGLILRLRDSENLLTG